MPDDHAAATKPHAQSPSASAASPAAADAVPAGLVEHLLADIHALQAREDEMHQRLLDQIERRHAAEAALFAERFKVAVLQRDLELVQLRLKSVHELRGTEVQAESGLERSLHYVRAALSWRVRKARKFMWRKVARR